MQFIKTLFWVILAVIIVVFAANNWTPVSVLVWENLRIDSKLPVLVIGAFLLGFVPAYMLYKTTKWRLSRRVKTLEEAARPKVAPSAPVSSSSSQPAPLDLSKEQIKPSEPAPALTPVTEKPNVKG